MSCGNSAVPSSHGGAGGVVLAYQPSWKTPRLANISKYCVVRAEGTFALALSHVYAMLTPSIGFCAMPLTIIGAGMAVTSRIVGTISIIWWNWLRIPPASLIRFGHAIAM